MRHRRGRRCSLPRPRGTRAIPPVSPARTPSTRCGGTRCEFIEGREQIVTFLRAKWDRELDYALCKELWAFSDDRIAVRFQYELHVSDGRWFRSYGNENWEFDEQGFMRRREASINNVPITADERRILRPRPDGETTGLPLR
jgi:uncharacterized protein